MSNRRRPRPPSWPWRRDDRPRSDYATQRDLRRTDRRMNALGVRPGDSVTLLRPAGWGAKHERILRDQEQRPEQAEATP